MVTVAHQHVLQVLLPPRIEILRIIAGLPLVERLVNNDKPHAVAKVEELRRRLVVAAPDGIYPYSLQISNLRSMERKGRAVPKEASSWCKQKPFNFKGFPLSRKPRSEVNSHVRTPNTVS